MAHRTNLVSLTPASLVPPHYCRRKFTRSTFSKLSLERPEFGLGVLGARAHIQLHIALPDLDTATSDSWQVFEVMTCRRTKRTLGVATRNVSNGARLPQRHAVFFRLSSSPVERSRSRRRRPPSTLW